MIIAFFRTLILYLAIVTSMRIMGKRQMGEMQPSEFVVAIMLSEIASIPIQDTNIPLIVGLVPIITLLLFEVAFSFILMKIPKARSLASGSPSILISNGKINEGELERLRFNVQDLMEELRAANTFDICDVEFAILETSGRLSVMPRSDKRPMTPHDMGICPPREAPPHTVISDGRVNLKNLKDSGHNQEWLLEQLSALGANTPKDVLYAAINSDGQLFMQKKSQYKERKQ